MPPAPDSLVGPATATVPRPSGAPSDGLPPVRGNRLSDFDYALPAALIAQHPAPVRSQSRLLRVTTRGRSDHHFHELPTLLEPGDLCVVNDTRVIKARLFGRRDTGGRVEALVDQIINEVDAWVLLRASHLPRTDARLRFGDVTATVLARDDASGGTLPRFHLRFDRPLFDVLQSQGRLPLPPYIRHDADPGDSERYQTVYATEPGAVAAPTAGLHFDDTVFAGLAARGVDVARLTLHVGAGTFLPVRSDDLAGHSMHAERFRIGAETEAAIATTRTRGGRIVAVGTTVLRALEASGGLAGSGQTDLFIRPGYRFQVVDRLVTNLHLPRSTLLILVSAFAGSDRIRDAYAHAIAQRYRFFSYGDAMLLDRAEDQEC